MDVFSCPIDVLHIKRIDTEKRQHDLLVDIGVRIMRSGSLAYSYYQTFDWYNEKLKERGLEPLKNEPMLVTAFAGSRKPIFREPQNITGYLPDVIGWCWNWSMVIECKTSRSDFLRDKKKKYDRAGSLFYYLTNDPKAIKICELNEYEGLLFVDNQFRVTQLKVPMMNKNANVGCETAILLSILRGSNRNAIT